MKELNYFKSWLSVHFWSFGQFIKNCTVCNVWIVCNVRSLRISLRKKEWQNTCQLNWLSATFWATHKKSAGKTCVISKYLECSKNTEISINVFLKEAGIAKARLAATFLESQRKRGQPIVGWNGATFKTKEALSFWKRKGNLQLENILWIIFCRGVFFLSVQTLQEPQVFSHVVISSLLNDYEWRWPCHQKDWA